ncbi:MAG: NAD(P)H-dependent oxidoreductase [Megasphaera sp.]|jgi:flavodoxin|nr:NAD(P)H-dependent oxidoreductase [Megasphaera sp.]
MMKKLAVGVIAALMVGIFAGCGSQSTATQNTNGTQQAASTAAVQPGTSLKNGSRVLVVYFSYADNEALPAGVDASARASRQVENGKLVGNTGLMSEWIAQETKGDTYSIKTVQPYPSDYDETVKVGKDEAEKGTKPELQEQPLDLSKYDVIFVGYPNWWGDMPMAMYSFFDTHDFAGKTIIPFCTSGGSGFGNTVDAIRKAEPQATVVQGIAVHANDVKDAKAQVTQWVSGIDLNQGK